MTTRLYCALRHHDWARITQRRFEVIDYDDYLYAESCGGFGHECWRAWHEETDWRCTRCGAEKTTHAGRWPARPYRQAPLEPYSGPDLRIRYPE